MGRTRTRVTLLVLGLELLGFVLLGFAFWLAGGTELACRPESPGRLTCVLEERRLVWLLKVREIEIPGITAARVDSAEPTWLVVDNAAGAHRTLRGSPPSTEADAFQLEALRKNGGAPIGVVRGDLGWAFLTATFGLLWLIVISLIMKEFLGFHTPWWVGLFRRG